MLPVEVWNFGGIKIIELYTPELQLNFIANLIKNSQPRAHRASSAATAPLIRKPYVGV